VISPPETPSLQSKSFLTDDPALVVLYKQLRDKSLQTLRGALSLSPRNEWDFVLHTSRLYERMGCDLLALDLVRTWEFLQPPAQPPPTPSLKTRPGAISDHMPRKSSSFLGQPPSALDSYDIDPRKVMRRRSSLVVADLPILSHHSQTHEYVIREHEKEPDGDNMKDEEKTKTNGETKKPPPTAFKEPDMNSLLDSFGF
jgi:hypothetical protein